MPPVCIEVPHSRDVFTTTGATEFKSPAGNSRCFNIPSDDAFSMVLPRMSHDGPSVRSGADELVPSTSPSLYAERSFMGYGQERGGVQAILVNPSPDTPVEFVYFESLPWFMRIYLHTLRTHIEYDPATGVSEQLTNTNGDSKDIVQEIYYRPALDRVRGTQLELRVRIPPASRVVLSYDFEQTILRYTEYPPDANRGFDVAAAVITILDPPSSTTSSKTSNLRTTGLLLSLPTPDFSMPYNVIIFTSTAIALAFGGLYNILVRRFVAADEAADASAGGLKGKLLVGVRKLLGLVKGQGAAAKKDKGPGGKDDGGSNGTEKGKAE